MVAQENFLYSKNIQNIKPLVLNLTITKNSEGKRVGELRKVFIIPNDNDDFWKDFFAASLSGTPVKAEVLIEFRNNFLAAAKLKELGLLKQGTIIKED